LEETLLHSFLKASRLKHWLARPDCPPAIKECKILFDRLSSSTTVSKPVTSGQTSPARVQHNGLSYTQSTTHLGNSLILFSPNGDTSISLVPGQIKHITTYKNITVFFVHRYLPLKSGVTDPFQAYIHIPIKLYSSQVDTKLEVVQVNWVTGHFALCSLSDEHIAVVSLSKIRYIFSF
jgi:hypothetical protein